VTVIAFDVSGNLALTGAQDGSVILWTMGVDRQVRRFADDKVVDGFAALAVRPDGRRMVTGTMNTGEALYWDIDPSSPTNGTVRARLGGYQGAMVSVTAFSPDGRSAMIGSADWLGDSGAKKLILWNLDETSADFGKPIYTLTGFTYYPRSAAFTLDGSKVLVGTENLQGAGELAVLEVATGTVHHIDTGRDVSAILMTPDGKHALTASAFFKDVVELDIDLTSSGFGKEIRHIPTRTFTYDLKWGPNGNTLFVAENDTGLAERDYPTGTIIRQFQGRGSSGLWTIALSPDKRYVATGDADGIALWDYKSGSELWYSSRQESSIFNVAFSPDSQMVFSQAAPGQPVEWRVSEPSLDELLTWIPKNRYLREFTCAEREQYRIESLCQETK
jgi:WD40 repeat protein